MLKILPIQSKAEQEKICSLCNVKYNADLLAYAVYDDADLMGVCQFRLTASGGEIYDLAHANGTDSVDALLYWAAARSTSSTFAAFITRASAERLKMKCFSKR